MSKLIEVVATLALCASWFAVIQVAEGRMQAPPAAAAPAAAVAAQGDGVQVAGLAGDASGGEGGAVATPPARVRKPE